MDLIKRLQNIDRRIIYAVLAIAIALPLIKPLGIPVAVKQNTRDAYELLDAMNPGDVIVFSMDFGGSSAADVWPQAVAVAHHAIKKNLKIVLCAFWNEGAMFAEQIVDLALSKGYKYGENIVNLGYVAGNEAAIRSFAVDIHATFPKDHRSTDIGKIPMMQSIRDYKDWAMVVEFSAGNPGYAEWNRQVIDPFKINYVLGTVTVSVPGAMPFYQSGVFKGLLAGLTGAAEYEILVGVPGAAASGMDAQSLGIMSIVFFIVAGNIAYFLGKATEKKK